MKSEIKLLWNILTNYFGVSLEPIQDYQAKKFIDNIESGKEKLGDKVNKTRFLQRARLAAKIITENRKEEKQKYLKDFLREPSMKIY